MNPETLAELRGRIDTLDDQIITLLLERVQLSNTVMGAKAPAQIVDSTREQEITRRYTDRLASVSTPAKSRRVVQAVLGVSSLYPEPTTFSAENP